MATHANTTVNFSKQARTCAELAEAFHDADDAYLKAVAGGIMNRQGQIDARADALVEFLTGPRPTDSREAMAVIYAALQAVLDGNDFDPAWRGNVSCALVLQGARGDNHCDEVGGMTEADEAAYAAASFEPVSADTLARMTAELDVGKWNRSQQDLRALMAVSFSLLGKTKVELVETANTTAGIEAMEEVIEAFRGKAEWLRSAASFLDTASVRIMSAYAAANAEAGGKAVRS